MKPLVLMALTALAAHAAAVPVCLSKLTVTDNFAIAHAQSIVIKLFDEAGVRVQWLSSRECRNAQGGAIHLVLDAQVPARFGPSSMGYAQPYGAGAAIHLFYDRIRADHRTDFDFVLGHAMAHEIAHVLEGVARHSEGGIMKALWTTGDYDAMRRGRLVFDREDLQLIQLGMTKAAGSMLTARN